LVVEKLLDLIARGQDATDIEEGTADEVLVRTRIRREDVEHLELGVDVLVNVIVFGWIVPGEAVLRLEVREADSLELIEVAAQDGHFAALVELDQAGAGDTRDAVVAAAEDGVAGDVTGGAVGEPRDQGKRRAAG